MNRFKELIVWQKAISLTTKIYQLTSEFPKHEIYGITSQLTRSAVSIPSNIAEGAGRNSDNEFYQFLGIAIGSCFELETQLIIAKNISLISKEVDFDNLQEEIISIQNMLIKLQKSLKK